MLLPTCALRDNNQEGMKPEAEVWIMCSKQCGSEVKLGEKFLPLISNDAKPEM